MKYFYPNRSVIPIIDLEISGKCNLHCPICWGTPRNMKQHYKFSEWLELLKVLQKSFGLKGIALTGGEPLLVPNIDNFIKEAKQGLGLCVNLLTNACYLDEHFNNIKPFLSTISIPLDGPTEEINKKIRGVGHFNIALNWISRLNYNHLDLPLKVGTVVSALNIKNVPDIGEVLLQCGVERRYPEQDVWKLYQATPFGAEQNNPLWKLLRISDSDFRNVAKKTKQKYKGKINSVQLSTKEVGGYCIIIRPNGNVVANSNKDGKEHLLFNNIFTDTMGAMVAISSYHDVKRGIDRLTSSYFGQGLN
ncbi:MAG: radical SAM protein [bacterium]